jgi:hypothetical protein
MMASALTVQTILDRFLPEEPLDGHRLKVCARLTGCRTARMGGMEMRCDHCNARSVCYYGCRDRHCPQCQGRASQRWSDRQRALLLPVPYFHVVFTLPHTLNGWVQLHPEVLYRCLFQAVWNTLNQFGRNTRHLRGELGMTAVLHTWGQNLSRHVHVHCLIPGGVLTGSGQWHKAKSHYLFPVRALSRRFRGRMVSLLRVSANAGELNRVTNSGEVDDVLNRLMQQEWVVYTRHCLNQADTVVDYLARYTHRIAISNGRLLSMEGNRVSFRYKDYRDHGRLKTQWLEGREFVRRLLMHILPKGFMRIRHFGYLSNRTRRQKLAVIRHCLLQPPQPETNRLNQEPHRCWPCTHCNEGLVRMVRQIPRFRIAAVPTG